MQALSGREFTLDAAANDAGDNAMSTEYHSPSNSFLSRQHSAHVWLNAPFAKLVDFVKHYAARKVQQPDLSACIVVLGLMQEAVKPYLTGMRVLKHYCKGTALFEGMFMGLKLQTLLDSGATDSFTSTAAVRRLRVDPNPVAVANSSWLMILQPA